MPRVRCGDIGLNYEVSGRGQPLLFIHGLGSSTRDWEAQVAFFAQYYKVVTVDLRGHGLSDKPKGPYSIPLFATDIAVLMRSLNIAPAHVVGISMGGMIAFQLALDFPNLVKIMVIVNSGPAFTISNFKQRLWLKQRVMIVRLLGMRVMGEVLGGRLFPEPQQNQLRRRLVERWAKNDKRAYLASLYAMVGWSVADRLHSIICPTLVVAADQDYTPVSLKQAFVGSIPEAELVVIDDSRHMTPIDQPEHFNQVLMTFLVKHTPPE